MYNGSDDRGSARKGRHESVRTHTGRRGDLSLAWEAEINNHHPNREKYERMKELAGQKGIEINDT